MPNSTAALAYTSEDLDQVRWSDKSTSPRREMNIDLAAVLMRSMAVAAAVGATVAHGVPTLGYVRTALSEDAISSDPPDVSNLMPQSWINTVSLIVNQPATVAYSAAIADLHRLRKYEAGWNGPRSKGANAASFDAAEKFVRELSLHGLSGAKVLPTIFAHGAAALEIQGGDFSALIEFGSDGNMFGAFDVGGHSDDFEGQAAFNSLPLELLNRL